MLWLASSPIFSWRSPTSRVLQTDRSQPIVSLDGFMTRGWTPSVPEAAQADALAFVSQPWSYLRLKAYSFIWLCEGAYGDFGGSVLNNSTQGLTH